MRSSFFACLYGAQLVLANTLSCNEDNCLRAVQASSFPTRHGSADCSSFFATTVTPDPVTVTEITTYTIEAVARKRAALPAVVQVGQTTSAPTSVPAYASACSGTARYSSACSCIGAKPTTQTVATPTTTITSTVTVTSYVPTATVTFLLRLVNSGLVVNNVPLDGTFGTTDNGDGELVGFNGDAGANATPFVLNAAGNLVMALNGYIGYQDVGQPFELLHFNPPQTVLTSGGVSAVCSIVDNALKCATDGNTIFELCPGFAVTNDLFLANSVHSGCTAVTIDAIFIP